MSTFTAPNGNTAPMTLHYWKIKARSYAAMAVAQAGGLNVVHTDDPNLAELKPSLPFGQLPYLVDGDVKVAQSLAIVRYLARKGGLQGDDDKGFAFSEMLIQEMEDIFTLMAKANYEKDKVGASFLILFLKFVLSFSAIPTSCNL